MRTPQTTQPQAHHSTWHLRSCDQQVMAFQHLTKEEMRHLFIAGLTNPCGLRRGYDDGYLIYWVRIGRWAISDAQLAYLEELEAEFAAPAEDEDVAAEPEPKMAAPSTTPAPTAPAPATAPEKPKKKPAPAPPGPDIEM